MVRLFAVPCFLSIIATIILSQVLAIALAIPLANLAASLVVASAMICALVLQRRGIGPSRSLLKQQYFLYAALGPVLICLVMLRDFADGWLGVPPRHASLVGLALFVAIMSSLMLLLPRVFFSAEERAELKAKTKAIRAVEKFWASRPPLSAVPGVSKLRGRFSGWL
jgi:hypothetical protein